MRSSIPLYDALADDYDAHFQAPHRRAYDDLAWEIVSGLVPAEPTDVVDAGCGSGRWAARLAAAGHRVIGIEQAPQMLAAARRRTPAFALREGSMEAVELPAGQAGLVMAMGSLQYTRDPVATIARFAGWTRAGGHVAVLVDSLVALVLELVAAGRPGEAEARARTRRGVWRQHGREADLHLFDRAALEGAFAAAGLTDVRAYGLLVGASALGRSGLAEALAHDYAGALVRERALAMIPALADVGKQLLVVGRRA